ncbi:MAG TPA: hypothetical protein VMU34_11055 [Mycobacterium sp.]|nr:hypothetical protein [Mycobacterium sp.]
MQTARSPGARFGQEHVHGEHVGRGQEFRGDRSAASSAGRAHVAVLGDQGIRCRITFLGELPGEAVEAAECTAKLGASQRVIDVSGGCGT